MTYSPKNLIFITSCVCVQSAAAAERWAATQSCVLSGLPSYRRPLLRQPAAAFPGRTRTSTDQQTLRQSGDRAEPSLESSHTVIKSFLWCSETLYCIINRTLDKFWVPGPVLGPHRWRQEVGFRSYRWRCEQTLSRFSLRRLDECVGDVEVGVIGVDDVLTSDLWILQILNDAKKFLLSAIAETSPAALSSSQLTQVTTHITHCKLHICVKIFTHLSLVFGLAGVSVCRSGPGGVGGSVGAPQPSQPEPGDGLPLNMIFRAEPLTVTDDTAEKQTRSRCSYSSLVQKNSWNFVKKTFIYIFLYITLHMYIWSPSLFTHKLFRRVSAL